MIFILKRINSLDWWNNYFENNWEINRGVEQTSYFMNLIINELPEIVKLFMDAPGTEILDWGCAMGQGVDLLSRNFTKSVVSGLDASTVAIEKAAKIYPHYEFTTKPLESEGRRYDVIFCSNCLEHYANPMEIIRYHLRYISNLYIILVPYMEENLAESHFFSFNHEFFPNEIDRFYKIYSKIINTTSSGFWNGSQILIVYANCESPFIGEWISVEREVILKLNKKIDEIEKERIKKEIELRNARTQIEALQKLLCKIECSWPGRLSRFFDTCFSCKSRFKKL